MRPATLRRYGCEGFQWYHRGASGQAVCNNGAADLFDGDGWILLADTGTAVTALALGAQLAPAGSARRSAYTQSLRLCVQARFQAPLHNSDSCRG